MAGVNVHELPPFPQGRRLAEVLVLADALSAGIRERDERPPEDCVVPCWKHGGDLPCTCGGDEDGTTAAPGGW